MLARYSFGKLVFTIEATDGRISYSSSWNGDPAVEKMWTTNAWNVYKFIIDSALGMPGPLYMTQTATKTGPNVCSQRGALKLSMLGADHRSRPGKCYRTGSINFTANSNST